MKKIFLLAAALLAPAWLQAGPDVLLLVDVSNPAAVTFTATGNFASADASTGQDNGVDLLRFLSTTSTAGLSVSGNLSPSGSNGTNYNESGADNFSGSEVDWNVWVTGVSSAQFFSTSTVAFTGVATINFSSISADLPTTGTIGNIIDGFSFGGDNFVIGQYEVVGAAVPEPATWALLAGAVTLGVAAWRRHARR